jgi:hypothetical protein
MEAHDTAAMSPRADLTAIWATRSRIVTMVLTSGTTARPDDALVGRIVRPSY